MRKFICQIHKINLKETAMSKKGKGILAELKCPTLFDTTPRLAPCDPNVDSRDVPRLSRQCQLILDMLRERPRTNAELITFAMNLTGRVSDLRANGYRIKCERLGGGLHRYTLEN